MYGVQGRTWVALGDPVGPPARIPELIRAVPRAGATTSAARRCSTRSARQHLHHYADFGLTFVKLGEEAQGRPDAIHPRGRAGAQVPSGHRRLEKDGGTFRVVQPADVPAIMAELRAVSDDWLRQKAGAEKGFSLGFFDPEYLSRFPVAVDRARRTDSWRSPTSGRARASELSIDLMRYHGDAPRSDGGALRPPA